jgi:hypothetical protein
VEEANQRLEFGIDLPRSLVEVDELRDHYGHGQ